MKQISRILYDENGASAVEYALLVALIAAVTVVATITLGTRVRAAFAAVCDALNGGEGTCG